MFDYRAIKALFIDVDDTIIRFRDGASTSSLMNVLQEAGVALSGLSTREAERRISEIKSSHQWWHWSDFIVALELNPKEFWDYALRVEQRYLQPTGPEMALALKTLKDAGYLLYVTSNNPSSGILHKLSLAGLATIHGAPLFHQLLGASELHAMKWEPLYWRKALAHTGLEGHEVAILGDDAHDDLAIPASVGIAHTFLINRYKDLREFNSGRVTHVMNFDSVVSCLLPGNNLTPGGISDASRKAAGERGQLVGTHSEA